jgi:hypothetical protein
VDEPQTWSKRIGLTRGKAVVVSVLAVTLVVVIYVKYGPSGAAAISNRLMSLSGRRPGAKSDSQASAAKNANTTQLNAAELLSVEVDESRWKSPDLSVVLAYDPFALPSGFPQPQQAASASSSAQISAVSPEEADIAAEQLAEAIETLRMELEQLQQRGVHVIVRGRDEYVAMIGDRTIHVGDEISGFTVTAIEPDHVRVERKVQK